MKKLFIIFAFVFVLTLGIISSTTLYQDVFKGYRATSITGNESVIFGKSGIEIDNNNLKICLNPIVPDSYTRQECECISYNVSDPFAKCLKQSCNNVTYYHPSNVPVYDKEDSLKTTLTKSLVVEDMGKYCLSIINPLDNLLLRLGFSSIILTGDTTYNSTDKNITQETGFAHLNISTTAPFDSLELYYPFDVNTTTNTFDYTLNDDDGTLNGVTFNSSGGMIGSAYVFDGVLNNISFPYMGNSFYNSDATVSVWVRTSFSAAGSPQVFRTNTPAGVQFWMDGGTGVMNVFWGASQATSSTAVNDGEWHHVVIVRSGLGADQSRIYIDGTSEDTGTTANIDKNANVIGGPSAYWNGSLDEIMMFSVALNSSDVTTLFNNQSARFFNNGEQDFNDINVSEAGGGENRLNISLADYQHLFGTNISVSINGTFTNLSDDGTINNLPFSTSPQRLNITFRYLSDSNSFYTPNLIGNITLDAFVFTPPTPEQTTLKLNWTDKDNGNNFDRWCLIVSTEELCFNSTSGLIWGIVGDIVQLVASRNVFIDGDLNVSGNITATNLSLSSNLFLPQENDAMTPTLSFGDGDSGFFESSDDVMRIAIAKSSVFLFNSNSFRSSATNPTAAVMSETATSTNPVFAMNGDLDTGIGSVGSNILALIAGGLNIMNIMGSGVNISGDLNVTGNITGNYMYGDMRFHDVNGKLLNLKTLGVYENLSGFNISLTNGFAFDNNATLTAQVDGVYKCEWHISFESGANNEFGGDVLNNGIPQELHGHRHIGTAADVGNFGAEGIIRINKSDVLTLAMRDEDAPVADPTIEDAGLACHWVGS